MAGFKAHLTGGVMSGAGVSALALFTRALTLTQAVAIFFVGTVAGLLPDLDSDTADLCFDTEFTFFQSNSVWRKHP